jgi:hypothetical protein
MIGVLHPSITPRSAPMPSLPQVAATMQHVLTTEAEAAARATGCVQRERAFSGATWVQTLVFGCLGTPQPSLEALAQSAAARGVAVTPQALDQRFTPAGAACLERVLAAAVTAPVAADPVAVPLLRRFAGVYVLDTTSIALPAALAPVWPGCGNGAQPTAATLKLGVRLELTTGALAGPALAAGRTHDRAIALASAPLPPEALRLADLGFWKLDELRELSAAGSFWLSRLQAQVAVFDAAGQRWEAGTLLATQAGEVLDLPVTLGVQQRLPARLLAQRVPPAVAEERRRRLRAEAKRRGQTVSQARLALADWLLFVTNVPPERLNVAEALVLARARWQIGVLFKLWKSHGRVDASRSAQPWRVLCELYATLIAMVLQHWTLLLGCWACPARSLAKAAQVVRTHARLLAVAVPSRRRLRAALATVRACLGVGCRLNPRRAKPNTYQLLLAFPEVADVA